jgi:cell division ATPase FtsA
MTEDQKLDLVTAASNLYANLKADIENAGTRIEHIRISSLAQEAAHLLEQVRELTGIQELPTDN